MAFIFYFCPIHSIQSMWPFNKYYGEPKRIATRVCFQFIGSESCSLYPTSIGIYDVNLISRGK